MELSNILGSERGGQKEGEGGKEELGKLNGENTTIRKGGGGKRPNDSQKGTGVFQTGTGMRKDARIRGRRRVGSVKLVRWKSDGKVIQFGKRMLGESF